MDLESEPMDDAIKFESTVIYASIVLQVADAVRTSTVQWYRFTFLQFLGSFSALLLSIHQILVFALGHAHEYTKNQHMLSSLYGESSKAERLDDSEMQSVQFGVDYAKEAFEVHVKSRNELVSSYGSYLMFGFFANFCCCIKNCLDRKGGMRKNARRYLKFRLALERLAQEQDIQYIMQMNRVTHLIHSSTFLAR